MSAGAGAGRPGWGGRPATLTDLIQALSALDSLDPIEEARRYPDLIEAAKSVLSRQRGAAMLKATTGPGAISQTELARQLGIHRVKVAEAIGAARREAARREGECGH